MNTRLQHAILALVLSAAALSTISALGGCAHAQTRDEAVHVVESGVEVHSHSAVFWISPDEVIFIGPTDEQKVDGPSRQRLTRVTTWDARTKNVRRLAAADAGLCYDRGRIAYREIENWALRSWTSIGRHPGTIPREERDIRYDEPMSCMPIDALPPLPVRSVEHDFVRLLPEHGFIDLGQSTRWTENTAIHLQPPDGGRLVELPLKRREIQRGTIKFFAFKGAYFVESVYFDVARGYETAPWPEGVPRAAWWLYPDGKVERMTIAPAAWARGRIVPTRAGLLGMSNAFSARGGAAASDGVYVISNGNARRVLRGSFGASAVSADGCAFAVRRQPNPGAGQRDYWTLSLLRVCKEEK